MMWADPATTVSATDFDALAHEHRVLVTQYGHAQTRCSERMALQAAEIERLQAQAMRLHAAVIIRDTALAFACEDRATLEASIPDLPTRVKLAHRVEALKARVQILMRERLQGQRRPVSLPQAVADAMPTDQPVIPAYPISADSEDLNSLEASLVAADLVICQTGCLSHGAYWRVQANCKRTGKACVLVEQPEALRIVRIHRTPQNEVAAANLSIGSEEV